MINMLRISFIFKDFLNVYYHNYRQFEKSNLKLKFQKFIDPNLF
jgi:hypothetical protein